MPTISAFDAKTRFGELLARVEKGEEIVITRHARPVARMVPEGFPQHAEVRRAVDGLRELQDRIRKRGKGRLKLTDAEVRAAVEEGRK